MNKILVPVDFSPSAANALAYAIALAQPFGAEIILLHVDSPSLSDPNVLFFSPGPVFSSETQIRERLQQLASRQLAAGSGKLSIRCEVRAGSASDEILAFCDAQRPNLVVMGMSGKKEVASRLLGSTASWVMQRAACPVLVVPETAQFAGIGKIAYATNFEEGDLRVLDQLLVFARVFDAMIYCVHIRNAADQEAALKKEIITKAFEHELVVDSLVFESIDYDHVVEGLNDYSERKEIDLMVMLTHHRNIFSQLFNTSHTQEMALKTDVPLWVFQIGGGIQDVFFPLKKANLP